MLQESRHIAASESSNHVFNQPGFKSSDAMFHKPVSEVHTRPSDEQRMIATKALTSSSETMTSGSDAIDRRRTGEQQYAETRKLLGNIQSAASESSSSTSDKARSSVWPSPRPLSSSTMASMIDAASPRSITDVDGRSELCPTPPMRYGAEGEFSEAQLRAASDRRPAESSFQPSTTDDSIPRRERALQYRPVSLAATTVLYNQLAFQQHLQLLHYRQQRLLESSSVGCQQLVSGEVPPVTSLPVAWPSGLISSHVTSDRHHPADGLVLDGDFQPR